MEEQKKELGFGDIMRIEGTEIQKWIQVERDRVEAIELGILMAMQQQKKMHDDFWDFIIGKYPELNNKRCSVSFDKEKKEWYIIITGNRND